MACRRAGLLGIVLMRRVGIFVLLAVASVRVAGFL